MPSATPWQGEPICGLKVGISLLSFCHTGRMINGFPWTPEKLLFRQKFLGVQNPFFKKGFGPRSVLLETHKKDRYSNPGQAINRNRVHPFYI